MAGILLDTHALYWFVSGQGLLALEALVAIGQNQQAGELFVSPISAWEMAVASQKRQIDSRPHLGDDSPDRWFRDAVRAVGARVVPIRQRISCEAARVATETGHRDPGDCFLIATARVRRIPIVTRDAQMLDLAKRNYLQIIAC